MNLRNKLAIVGLTGAVFTGGVFGLAGLASAQSPAASGEATEAEQITFAEEGAVEADGMTFGFSAEDEAILEGFEECLVSAGVVLDDEPMSFSLAVEVDVDGDDVVFEECEAELDGLSFEGDGEWIDEDLSPEDEAIFEQYDECFENIDGVSFDEDVEWTEEDFEKFEAAAETCEGLLDGLSFDIDEGIAIEGDWDDFEGDWDEIEGDHTEFDLELTEEDGAVFEKFDGCIADTAGVDFETEADLTDDDFERLDAAFEECEHILEDLSEGSGFFIESGDVHAEDGEFEDGEADHGETVETLLNA